MKQNMEKEKFMDVEIITPDKVVYSGKARSVSVQGSLSPFQILYNHAPIVSTLDPGEVKVIDESHNINIFKTSSGFTEVLNNHISVLVESAE